MSHITEWRNVYADRKDWPSGEWDNEPDKIHWVDDASDLDCLMHRNDAGAWCGYVGVSEGHPAFQKDYNDVSVDVHGGLTYADFCQVSPDGEEHPETGICHVPLEGRPHRVWWFGFDCYHLFDLAPATCFSVRDQRFADPQDVYRNRHYVEKEVTSLAKQLAEMAA